MRIWVNGAIGDKTEGEWGTGGCRIGAFKMEISFEFHRENGW